MGSTATELVKQFEMRYSKSDKKPDASQVYFGAVVRADEGEEFALFANLFKTREQAELINTQELAISKRSSSVRIYRSFCRYSPIQGWRLCLVAARHRDAAVARVSMVRYHSLIHTLSCL